MSLKYVCGVSLVAEDPTKEIAVIFPSVLVHAEVARRLHMQVLGAGFCTLANGEWVAKGESESLRVKSRPRLDGETLNKQWRNHR